jgi:hypothetical protein
VCYIKILIVLCISSIYLKIVCKYSYFQTLYNGFPPFQLTTKLVFARVYVSKQLLIFQFTYFILCITIFILSLVAHLAKPRGTQIDNQWSAVTEETHEGCQPG